MVTYLRAFFTNVSNMQLVYTAGFLSCVPSIMVVARSAHAPVAVVMTWHVHGTGGCCAGDHVVPLAGMHPRLSLYFCSCATYIPSSSLIPSFPQQLDIIGCTCNVLAWSCCTCWWFGAFVTARGPGLWIMMQQVVAMQLKPVSTSPLALQHE